MSKGRKRQPRPRPRRSRRTRGAKGGGTGSVNTKAELGIQCVDYFNYDYSAGGAVYHYFWDCAQNLFNNNTSGTQGEENSFCRIRKVELYALPRKGINSAVAGLNSNAAGMYTVNVQTPSMTYSGAAAPTTVPNATNTQVTNVLPQVDTMWKKVYTCDMQQTFQSGVIRPFYIKDQQCLFTLKCIDPVDGLDLDGIGSDTVFIRFKLVLTVDQPIMPIQTAERAIIVNNNIGQPGVDLSGVGPIPGAKYMQMDLKRVMHHMR